ncbi:pyridoxamine 5'-phosphate oxidase family protein [Shimia sp. R11_0]|uniref:pyridoxamine 5'-phosphate oxidase family protein n=1 Tax=Shimia sp. R11_0 TaxID=2821096 RepID=UPI001AD970BF|nr:pyridoxamine 5'-phosphate oxidase family protein [Shimia sp. R11_0]MBO9476223.1 pyridoxamine 5'-phosphate oxidase family protein [Shimia sp. R11_0]
MAIAFAEIAFTPEVQRQQEKFGATSYGRFLSAESAGGDRLSLTEATFIQAQEGFYQASVSETGWPYVQFRGGPAGFLKVLDDKTIAYADLRGNRQYISLGNLQGNDRISLILMDYVNARRLKIWGRVEIVDRDSPLFNALPASLLPPRAERLIKIHVAAFDWNCPQHIPRRFTEGEAVDRIAELEAENAALRVALRDGVGAG